MIDRRCEGWAELSQVPAREMSDDIGRRQQHPSISVTLHGFAIVNRQAPVVLTVGSQRTAPDVW